MYVERRCRMVSRIPPVSPASTMFTYKGSNTFGEPRIAESIRPLVREHGRGGGDRRYSRHHSAAPLDLHRKERQAAARRQVRPRLSCGRLDRRRRRHHPATLESRADFLHLVCGPGRGSPAAHENRHRSQSIRRQHFWFAHHRGPRGRYLWCESLVWHFAGTLCARFHYPEASRPWHLDEKDCRGPIYANAWHVDLQRRAYP